MHTKLTAQIQNQILQLAPILSQVEIAKKLNLQASTVSLYIRNEKNRIETIQNNLKSEHADLDTDIAFELSSLCQHSFDKEKTQNDLIDEFAELYGVTLTTLDDSYENKSEFLDFLKSKAYELC